jgi:PAS domain S-box-containing protein
MRKQPKTVASLSAALAESEARGRAVLATAVDGIITCDEHGMIEEFNPAAERIFGYSAQEVIGRHVGVLGPPPAQAQGAHHIGTFPNVTPSGVPVGHHEVLGARKDGSLVPLEISVSEVAIGGKKWFTGFVRDISRRKEAEAALRRTQQQFDAFMSHLPGVAYLKDCDGRYLYVSPAFEQHFRRPAADYLGRCDAEVWPADVAAHLRDNDRVVISSGQVLQTTETVPQDDGPHYWLSTKFPIFGPAGGVEMVGGIAVDVTDQRRAIDALRELQRVSQQRERLADVGAITAKILHDLANPLAGVSMQAQLILRRAARDPQQPASGVLHPAAQILSEVHRLDALIGELKDFARDQRLELRPLALRSFLQECIDVWRPLARVRNIAIHLEASEDLPDLRADRVKLRRVFDNLLKNAIEAIDVGPGLIRVRGEPIDQARVRIAVEDSGPGIPESVQPFRLFDTTKPYGTGLGLAIAKQIVQAHGGTIEYSPLQPRGTAFLLELAPDGPPSIT